MVMLHDLDASIEYAREKPSPAFVVVVVFFLVDLGFVCSFP